MKVEERKLHVDGITEEGVFQSWEGSAPFMVFDEDQQQNIAGPFNTMESAEAHRQEILAGAFPRMDAKALGRELDYIER